MRPEDEADGIEDPNLRRNLHRFAEKGNSLKLTEKEVRYVADLANLSFSDEEVRRFARDLDGILGHMDKLNELDTTNVEPMAQVLYSADETATLREDRERHAAREPKPPWRMLHKRARATSRCRGSSNGNEYLLVDD